VINAPLCAEMARRAVPADYSLMYLSDADWREFDALLASGGNPGGACDRMVEILARARARLPVPWPVPRERAGAGASPAAALAAAGAA
jgi:hypothetical protein